MFDISDGDIHGVEIKVRQGGSVSGVVVIEGSRDPKALSRLSQVIVMVSTESISPARRPWARNLSG